MLAQIDRAMTDRVVDVPLLGRLERAMHQVPDLAEAARDEARHLAGELREERTLCRSFEARFIAAHGDALRLADVARGYRNYLVLWFLTTCALAVGMVAEYLIMRGGS